MFDNIRKKIVQPFYFLSLAILLLAFALHFGESKGTLAISSDVENSEGNKFVAGEWEEEDFSDAKAGDVVINEIMWMGSSGNDGDEWIELRNTTGSTIDLGGWQLTKIKSGNETLMITIPNGHSIAAHGFFLISEYDKDNSKINVIPNLVIGSGSTNGDDLVLANSDLQIKLYKDNWTNLSNLIDAADDGSGNPFAGSNGDDKKSMQRNDSPGNGTQAVNWSTCVSGMANNLLYWDVDDGNNYGTPGDVNQ